MASEIMASDKKTIHRINVYVLRIPFRTTNPHLNAWIETFTQLPGVSKAADSYKQPHENALYLKAVNERELKAAVAWLKSYLRMDYEELSTSWEDVYPNQ